MSWFKRKVKPSRPAQEFTPPRIEFIGEQAGPVEDGLKSRFRELFAGTPTVQSAYLARLSIGEPGYTVGLCIRSSVGVDHRLRKQIGQIFAEVFRADEHLDILFMSESQEVDVRKVCTAFYERG